MSLRPGLRCEASLLIQNIRGGPPIEAKPIDNRATAWSALVRCEAPHGEATKGKAWRSQAKPLGREVEGRSPRI